MPGEQFYFDTVARRHVDDKVWIFVGSREEYRGDNIYAIEAKQIHTYGTLLIKCKHMLMWRVSSRPVPINLLSRSRVFSRFIYLFFLLPFVSIISFLSPLPPFLWNEFNEGIYKLAFAFFYVKDYVNIQIREIDEIVLSLAGKGGQTCFIFIFNRYARIDWNLLIFRTEN